MAAAARRYRVGASNLDTPRLPLSQFDLACRARRDRPVGLRRLSGLRYGPSGLRRGLAPSGCARHRARRSGTETTRRLCAIAQTVRPNFDMTSFAKAYAILARSARPRFWAFSRGSTNAIISPVSRAYAAGGSVLAQESSIIPRSPICVDGTASIPGPDRRGPPERF